VNRGRLIAVVAGAAVLAGALKSGPMVPQAESSAAMAAASAVWMTGLNIVVFIGLI